MDKVRTALAWLKQQHFWVLTVLVALIGMGCWWSAAGEMQAGYEKGKSTITAGFSEIQAVKNVAFHPNEAINTHQSDEIKKQSESVTKLWQQLYDKQRDSVLKWPDQLSKAFRDAVEKMQFNDEIPNELRNTYQNYIERHFPELPKRIGARPLEATEVGGMGGYGGRESYGPAGGAPGMMTGGMIDSNDYICEWLDQAVIRDELNFPQRPSSLRIWVTQEDLWVYHALLDVIAKTNQAAGATRMANAAVKTVINLQVGRLAAPFSRNPGRLAIQPAIAAAPPGEPGMGAAVPGAPGAADRRMGGGMESYGAGMGGGAALSPAAEQGFLLSGRYLDDKGQPIPVGGGGGDPAAGPTPVPDPAAAAGPAPPLDLALFGTGFKRLPIRMVLQMDVRWLPQLIAACANQPLSIEVQEVRINPTDIAGGGMMGGMEMMVGGGGGYGPGRGGGGGGYGPGRGEGGGMGGGMGGGAATVNPFPERVGIQNFPAQPHVVNVVIQGTITIFNKPNMNILATPAEPQTATAGL